MFGSCDFATLLAQAQSEGRKYVEEVICDRTRCMHDLRVSTGNFLMLQLCVKPSAAPVEPWYLSAWPCFGSKCCGVLLQGHLKEVAMDEPSCS